MCQLTATRTLRLAVVIALVPSLVLELSARPQDSNEWHPIIPNPSPPQPVQPIIDQQFSRVRIENARKEDELPNVVNRTARIDNDFRRRHTKAANPAIRESIKVVTNQLLDPSNITLDTRTPPKIKAQIQKMNEILKPIENSHPGIAVAVHEDEIKIYDDPATKRIVVHRNHNKQTTTPVTTTVFTTTAATTTTVNSSPTTTFPTTDGTLSTWILLSGHPTTNKNLPSKPIPNQNKTMGIVDKIRLNNKMRPSSVRKPNITTTETPEITTVKILNKVKASLLASNMKNVSSTTQKPTTTTSTSTTTTLQPSTTTIKTFKPTKANNTLSMNKKKEEIDSSHLVMEAKDGGMKLPNKNNEKVAVTTTKKPPKTTTASSASNITLKPKRKKNKNRRRRPGNNKTVNGTKTAVGKPQTKEKPISTQIYNYLSREVMPSVGVGLVGLVVTAGLAGYLLYPFGGTLRRAYDFATDRKDDKYYYNKDYDPSSGQAEEEVISKVIAGMPASGPSLQDYGYATPTSSGPNNRYRDYSENSIRYPQPSGPTNYQSYQAAYNTDQISLNVSPPKFTGSSSDLTYSNLKNDYSTPSTSSLYSSGSEYVMERQKETGYTVSAPGEINAQKFVVGSVPKDIIVTPAAVPEHGPRSLKIRRRKRRDTKAKSIDDNEISNEIFHTYEETTKNNYKTNTSNINITTENIKTPETELPLQNVFLKNNDTNPSSNDPALQNVFLKNNDTNSSSNGTEADDLSAGGIFHPPPPQYSFMNFLKNMLEFKLRFGLSLVQHTSDAIVKYVQGVHERMEEVVKQIRDENQSVIQLPNKSPLPNEFSVHHPHND